MGKQIRSLLVKFISVRVKSLDRRWVKTKGKVTVYTTEVEYNGRTWKVKGGGGGNSENSNYCRIMPIFD